MLILMTAGWIILSFIIASIIYILSGLLCTIIPANKGYQNVKRDIEIFVVSNGVHVDYVVPTISPYFNWKNSFNTASVRLKEIVGLF